MSYKYMSKQELCNAIYAAVLNAKKPMTRLEIAHAIGKKKAQHIIDMIEHLTATGYFTKAAIIDKFNRQAFAYSVVSENGEIACADAA